MPKINDDNMDLTNTEDMALPSSSSASPSDLSQNVSKDPLINDKQDSDSLPNTAIEQTSNTSSTTHNMIPPANDNDQDMFDIEHIADNNTHANTSQLSDLSRDISASSSTHLSTSENSSIHPSHSISSLSSYINGQINNSEMYDAATPASMSPASTSDSSIKTSEFSEDMKSDNNDNNKTTQTPSSLTFNKASKSSLFANPTDNSTNQTKTASSSSTITSNATPQNNDNNNNTSLQHLNKNNNSNRRSRAKSNQMLNKYFDPWYSRHIPVQGSSFLRPGSCFIGTQQSSSYVYEVDVEIKSVDFSNYFISGYLRICGLTENNAVMTTYFEGEMIGPKYSFYTRRKDWNANDQIDLKHWDKFRSWHEIEAEAKKQDYVHKDFDKRDVIYMRWKEFFLVPDYRVGNVQGASYEGFYYICFDQTNGSISGLYYHKQSHFFQNLSLSHVPDAGCLPSYEPR